MNSRAFAQAAAVLTAKPKRAPAPIARTPEQIAQSEKWKADRIKGQKKALLNAAAADLLAAAEAAWNCIAELPPTQARVDVALMLQAAIAKATRSET